jgi:urease beta subunit
MTMIPGEYILAAGNIAKDSLQSTIVITVINKGDRSIQVGSHFHFYEVDKQMEFDREKAFGMRLGIPAGTTICFEPGEVKQIELISLGGQRKVYGISKSVKS